MILKNVIITKLDLEGKENFYAGAKRFGLRHFKVIDDDGNRTFIRLANADALHSDELERKIVEVEKFQIGDRVDVDVELVDWTIKDLSGTSHWYLGIRSGS